MRVLLVHGWHPIEGGAEDYFSAVRQGLAARGDDVRLLASSAGSAAHGTADYVAYGTPRPMAQVLLQIANPWAVAAVRRALREFRPQVALVGVFADFLSPAIFEALREVPTVLAVVDYKVVCPDARKLLPDGSICQSPPGAVCLTGGCCGPLRWLRDRPRYALIGRGLAGVAHVVTCGRHIQRVLADHGVQASHLDWPVRPPPPSFLRAPTAAPTFLYVGRLSREKGVSVLLRSFAESFARWPAVRLRIAGDGPEASALRKLAADVGIADRVEFLGWRSPEQLEPELEQAWALVAPSVWAEPLGVVALEATVRDVPVVASATGGFAETVRPGASGLLVPNGDVGALAVALADVAGGRLFPDHRIAPTVRAEAIWRHDPGRHVDALRETLSRVARGEPVTEVRA